MGERQYEEWRPEKDRAPLLLRPLISLRARRFSRQAPRLRTAGVLRLNIGAPPAALGRVSGRGQGGVCGTGRGSTATGVVSAAPREAEAPKGSDGAVATVAPCSTTRGG